MSILGINCSPKDANLTHSKSSSSRGIFRKVHAQLLMINVSSFEPAIGVEHYTCSECNDL
jgi:hypothetical protein